MEQYNNATTPQTQGNMVFISPPCLKLDFDKNDYSWHLKISVECNLDFWDCQKVAKEFHIQSDIENALYTHFSSFCDIKQIAVCHQGNQNIHHWYISSEKIKLSIENILEFDKLNVQRAINFELTKDPDWKNAIPILEQMKDKILGLYSVLDQLKEN